MSTDNGGKKGMHPMAWVGIGCGTVMLIGVIAMVLLVGWCRVKVDEVAKDYEENPERTTAEMVVKLNPEIEKVSSDDAAGTITIREKKTGKEMTLNYADIQEGKFSVTTDEGTATVERDGTGLTTTTPDGQTTTYASGGIEKMPKMFEVPKSVTGWVSMMHAERDGQVTGLVRGESTETVDALSESFTRAMTVAGFTEASRVTVAHTTNISFEKKKEEEGVTESVTVSVVEESDKRIVQLTYVTK